jgi:hypothetical protein
VVVGPGDIYITFCTYKVFIPEQMIATGIAKPGKKKAYKIIPQIIDVIHAAMQNYFSKVIKIFCE